MLSHIFDTQFLLRLLRYPLGVLIAGLLMKGFWKLVEMEQPKEGYVSLPKVFLGMGLAIAVPTSVAGVYLIIDRSDWYTVFILAMIWLFLGVTPIMMYFSRRVSYDKEGFTIHGLFGIKHHYSYADITEIRDYFQETTLYMGKHRVSVDNLSKNGSDFIAQANRGYWKAYHKGIPSKGAKSDIFAGNVENGNSTFLVLVVILIYAFATIAYVWYAPPVIPMEDLHWETVQIDDCIPNEKQIDLFLLANGEGKCFVQQYGKVLPDPEKFQQLCREGTTFRIGVNEEEDGEIPRAEFIEDSAGTVYLTPEIVRIYIKGGPRWQLVPLFLAALWVLFLAYVVLMVKVGRHPERYPAWVIRSVFRDGTLRVKLKEDPWAKKPKKSRRWPWRRKEAPRRLDYRKKRLRKS